MESEEMRVGSTMEILEETWDLTEGEPVVFTAQDTIAVVRNALYRRQDTEYKAFHSRLMPTIDPETIIGVRTPALRKFAKQMDRWGNKGDFLDDLPHQYYEENNLHGFLIEFIKDFDKCLAEVDRFLPYVDNWATCDMMRPKVFKKNPTGLLPKIDEWVASGETYMMRYGIGMLMTYFLDEHFEVKYAEKVAAVESEEYYVKMMVAWYFATALAKQWDVIIPFIKEGRLEKWTHNKAIQKAIESYRITPEQKAYLRELKLK